MLISLLERITRAVFRRRTSHPSRHMTPAEIRAFRRQMAAHGVDDESRNEVRVRA